MATVEGEPAGTPGGEGWIRAADLDRLRTEGRVVFPGTDRPLVLFYSEGRVHALDNRCPHMGFPLSRGTVADGMVTCHWHHAAFDLASGCTFDLFAGDVPAYETAVAGNDVFVRPRGGRDRAALWRGALRDGLAQNVGLVIVKAVTALGLLGVPPRDIAAEAGGWLAANTPTFSSGMVILTAMTHVAQMLPSRLASLALSHGVVAGAAGAAGQPAFRRRSPLDRDDLDAETGKRWLRRFAAARQRDGAERTLLTLLRCGTAQAGVLDAVFSAITDRVYADSGHAVDFAWKAVELAELLGWEHAGTVLPCALPGSVIGARGAEEGSSWRHPTDLLALLAHAAREIPAAVRQGRGGAGGSVAELADAVLGEDPAVIVASLLDALRAGLGPDDLAQAVAHAACLRVARFGPSNEFGDWDTALHSLSYAQAMHHVACRADSPEVLRGIFVGALSVYQDRFLNVPPARLPGPGQIDGLPADSEALCARLLACTNAQGSADEAGRLVAAHCAHGLPPQPLLAALAEVVLREDAAFHTFQMLEAGIRLWQQWDGAREGHLALVALARYAAAHAPTQREFAQTVAIADRLHRGQALHEDLTAG